MNNNEAIELYRSIRKLTEDSLKREATAKEIEQVLITLASFSSSSSKKNEVSSTTSTVTKLTTNKATPVVHKKKRAERLVDWQSRDVRMMLDIVLDGNFHTISYADLDAIMPFKKIRKTVFSNYVRAEAHRRGYPVCHIQHMNNKRQVTIQALKEFI
jgi:hypothetical protein